MKRSSKVISAFLGLALLTSPALAQKPVVVGRKLVKLSGRALEDR